jgi:hypothetical protein
MFIEFCFMGWLPCKYNNELFGLMYAKALQPPKTAAVVMRALGNTAGLKTSVWPIRGANPNPIPNKINLL